MNPVQTVRKIRACEGEAAALLLLEKFALSGVGWIKVADEAPPSAEPVVYARPNPRRPGNWHVGIAYWTVSERWNPEMESEQAPAGFTHWKPLGEPPR